MDFSLDARTARLSVGEFSSFKLGPHAAGSGGGSAGVWRAQLGTHWHHELRAQATATAPTTEFEVPIEGRLVHRGWTLTLTGRIDQLLRAGPALTLREIKTVTRPLPADESELRRDYPEYFVQLATYAALWRLDPQNALLRPSATEVSRSPLSSLSSQLIFVEASSGLAQTVTLTSADDALLRGQLERVAEFLTLRHRARERLRHLRFRPPFASPRPGQETTQRDLTASFERHPLVLFEAPTGFGKTGVLLEFALVQLRSGHFDRALYLTSKSTGQLQVVRTLAAMTPDPSSPPGRTEKSNGELGPSAVLAASPTAPPRAWFALDHDAASPAAMEAGVRASAAFALLLTDGYFTHNVRHEVACAVALKKPLVVLHDVGCGLAVGALLDQAAALAALGRVRPAAPLSAR